VIIDFDKKFIFVHIPKTGGTSVTRYLAGNVPNGEVTPDSKKKHWSAKRVMIENPRDDYHTWTVAAIVRNPWDMIHSDWEFCIDHAKRRHKMNRERLGGWIDKLDRTAEYASFDEFVKREHIKRYNVWDHYCTDHEGNDLVNTVLQYEILNFDFKNLCAGLGYPVGDLPVVNKTKHRTDYREAYSDESRQLVEGCYAAYNERFGFTFDG
jgi:hypothetical protein